LSYKYTSFQGKTVRRNNNHVVNKVLLFLFLFLFIVFFITSIGYFYKNYKRNQKISFELRESYRKLYDSKNYLELIDKMDNELKNNSLRVEYLIYRGFSYYLLGEAEKDVNKRSLYFSLSIIDLRRSLAVGVADNIAPDVYFCIGKIYYFYGRSYYNQSIDYLKKSLSYGNERVDLLYVLGLVYSNISNYEESNKVFKRSLDIEYSDIVSIAVALNYYRSSDFNNAEKYINKVLENKSSDKIKETALITLAEIQLNKKEYEKALFTLNSVTELNENNADAFFLRGEIYFIYYKDNIRARSEWRKTLSINPSHIKAYRRL